MINSNHSYSHPLTSTEFEEFAKPMLLKLCVSLNPDPTDSPFVDRDLRRVILFPYSGINVKLRRGFEKACSLLKEEGFYLSVHGYNLDIKNEFQYHYYLLFKDYENFSRKFHPFEHTIYSVSGKWAVSSSEEGFGLLTCDETFLSNVERKVVGIENQVNEFLQHFFAEKTKFPKIRIDWIQGLLHHIYGEIEGTRLLKNAGFETYIRM